MNTHRISKPQGRGAFVALILLAVIAGVGLVFQRAALDAERKERTRLESLGGELLLGQVADQKEIDRLRSELKAIRPRLVGARTRIRELELFIDERNRIGDRRQVVDDAPPDVPMPAVDHVSEPPPAPIPPPVEKKLAIVASKTSICGCGCGKIDCKCACRSRKP